MATVVTKKNFASVYYEKKWELCAVQVYNPLNIIKFNIIAIDIQSAIQLIFSIISDAPVAVEIGMIFVKSETLYNSAVYTIERRN